MADGQLFSSMTAAPQNGPGRSRRRRTGFPRPAVALGAERERTPRRDLARAGLLTRRRGTGADFDLLGGERGGGEWMACLGAMSGLLRPRGPTPLRRVFHARFTRRAGDCSIHKARWGISREEN